MASKKSAYLEQAILNALDGTAVFPVISAVYFALFNGDPESGGTEQTTTLKGVATRDTLSLGAASSGANGYQRANSADIDITNVDLSSQTVDYFAVYDAATGGNMLYSGALSSSKTLANGETISFPAGNIVLAED